jgi:hypothetical protein
LYNLQLTHVTSQEGDFFLVKRVTIGV